MFSHYEALKSLRDLAGAKLTKCATVLNTFPSGPMGLTPDKVKADPIWQAVRRKSAQAFCDLQRINTYLTKHFTKEMRAERRQKGYAK